MMPRLAKLREIHPDIDLRMQNSDRDPELDVENLSLGIRIGNGQWRGYHSARLADEIIYPVASPQVMGAASNLRSVPNLMHERLIHLEEPIRTRPIWSQWFAHHGIVQMGNNSGLRLNDYALVLQAAVSGEGFAFGWDHVVRNLIERQTLVGRKEWSWHTGNGVYLVWSDRQALSAPAKQVRDWMISASDFPVKDDC
jgi:DNA-binding transcriptional LysR family regulator